MAAAVTAMVMTPPARRNVHSRFQATSTPARARETVISPNAERIPVWKSGGTSGWWICFLTHAERIKHPDPRAAVSMALMMVISTVLELVVRFTDSADWKGFHLPADDKALRAELTRAFLSYLGVEDLPGAAGKIEAEKLAAMSRWRERSSDHV
jgi:hypothetical protein